MLYGGFLESTGHTIPRGRGYVGVGYMGAAWLAQIGKSTRDAIRPYVAYGAYGVTDDLMVGMGSGFIRFNSKPPRFEYTPYVTAKFRVLSTDQSSAAIGVFWGVFSWAAVSQFNKEFNTVLFGLSGSYSRSFADVVALNGTIGMHGWSIDGGWQINDQAVYKVVLAIGAEVQAFSQLRLVSELRSFGGIVSKEEGFSEVLSVGLRYLGSKLSVEAGLADWLVDEWSGATRPILSLAYRF